MTPNPSSIQLSFEGSLAVITLSNPPANVWDPSALAELRRAMKEIGARGSIRSVIVTGAGDRFFSAGADLHQFDHADRARAAASMDDFAEAFGAIAAFPGITIAAINGFALGGGLECALVCDVRIAEAHARLGLPEALVGVLPGGGGTQRLPVIVGEAWAKRMIMLGERIDAQTAARIGLVEEVVPTGKALQMARALALQAADASPSAAAACKRLIEQTRSGGFDEGLVRERAAFADLFGTADQQEGVAAFLSKRSPAWATSGT